MGFFDLTSPRPSKKPCPICSAPGVDFNHLLKHVEDGEDPALGEVYRWRCPECSGYGPKHSQATYRSRGGAQAGLATHFQTFHNVNLLG